MPLLAAAAILIAGQQPSSPQPTGNFSIPAKLDTTIRADRAHPGDIVRFQTIQAVLVGQGLVMPENARLYGHVLGAAPRQGQKASWVSVVVDRAEWKQHSLPLRAFIVAKIVASEAKPSADTSVSNPRDVNGVLQQAQISRRTPLGLHSGTRVAPLATDDSVPHNSETLSDVKLGRAENGTTFLICERRNLKIPGGILFTLLNVPAGEAAKDDRTSGNPVQK